MMRKRDDRKRSGKPGPSVDELLRTHFESLPEADLDESASQRMIDRILDADKSAHRLSVPMPTFRERASDFGRNLFRLFNPGFGPAYAVRFALAAAVILAAVGIPVYRTVVTGDSGSVQVAQQKPPVKPAVPAPEPEKQKLVEPAIDEVPATGRTVLYEVEFSGRGFADDGLVDSALVRAAETIALSGLPVEKRGSRGVYSGWLNGFLGDGRTRAAARLSVTRSFNQATGKTGVSIALETKPYENGDAGRDAIPRLKNTAKKVRRAMAVVR
jgi:hypothetical protein